MSQFFSYTQPEYVRKLSKFLGGTHPAVQSLKRERHPGAKGRAPNYSEASIQSLEKAANDMASRCEAPDTCFKERFSLAAAYSCKKDAAIARMMGVSRQALGWWRAGACMPSHLECLAEVLNVPIDWLRYGGEEALPAGSHLGVRVGCESLEYRERLYGVTLDVIQRTADSDIEDINRAIGACISSNTESAKLSRRAGGRWLLQQERLVFAPWVPIREHGLGKRYWSDAVELVIEAALKRHHSVTSAFREVQFKCEEIGEKYPQKISLYKRKAAERQRLNRFGLNQQQVNFF